MSRETRSRGVVAVVLSVLLLVTGVTIVGPASGAVERVENRPEAYSLVQDGQCYPIGVVGDASETVGEYYDYRNASDSDYSSHGTDDRQVSGVSQLYVYRGARGDSLVFLHDERNGDGGGGALSMTVTGIPEAAYWAVEDDEYDGRDDRFRHDETSSTIDWVWAPERTDGAALLGLGHANDTDLVVEARFGEDSDGARELDWEYADDPVSWAVRGPDEELTTLTKDQRVRIRQGSCDSGTVFEAVAEWGDGDDTRIEDEEIQQAVFWWQTGTPVPGTDGATIDDTQIQQLVFDWQTNAPVGGR